MLSVLEQGGCSRLLFPRLPQRGESASLEAVMVNVSGGVAAGDHLEGRVTLGAQSDLLLTSQAHERIYRARPEDLPGSIAIHCNLAEKARLEWLPHGTIFFNGARLERKMTVEMASDARFLYYESRIFGRRQSDEVMQSLTLRDHLFIRRDGVLILRDSVILEEARCDAFLARAAVTGGKAVTATLVLVAPQAEDFLPILRESEQEHTGCFLASSAWNGMMILRVLAERSWDLECLMMKLLPVLREGRRLPSSWR